MISQNNLTPLTQGGVLPFSSQPFANLTGVQLPGTSIETQKLTLEILQKNHQTFDIFIDQNGLHNHLVHHALAAYSCGASEDLLKKIYDKHASYQSPKGKSHITITRENWTQHVGRNELWTDYLAFFDGIIQEEGMEKVFNEYAFHPEIFPRLFGGAFHPVIHLGYGIEFQIPMIVAEGLAQAAIHENRYAKMINEDYISHKGTQGKSIKQIIEEVQKDKRFDVITHSDKGKTRKLMRERGEIVKEVAKQWVIPETEEAVKAATKELYQTCVMAYGVTGMRPDKDKIDLDFFLMHGLTSVLMVTTMLPYVTLDKRIQLLRAHFAGVLTEYIARGRPQFHPDLIKKYTPKKLVDEPNPWIDIVKHALLELSDSHVLEATRSLLKAEQEWPSTEKEDLYAKIAQLTYEGYTEYSWSEDIGFDEEWEI